MQFILFLGRYVLSVNSLATRFASWLVRHDTIGVDDGHRIFNVECRASHFEPPSGFITYFLPSTRNTQLNGRFHTSTHKHAFGNYIRGYVRNWRTHAVFDPISPSKCASVLRTTFGLVPAITNRLAGLGLSNTSMSLLSSIITIASTLTPHRPYGLSVPYRRLFERFEAILSKHKVCALRCVPVLPRLTIIPGQTTLGKSSSTVSRHAADIVPPL